MRKGFSAAVAVLFLTAAISAADFTMPEIEEYPIVLEVLYDEVDVYDIPDRAAGKVVAQLNKGDSFYSPRSTKYRLSFDNYNSYWFYIEADSFSGWISGAFVELTEAQ